MKQIYFDSYNEFILSIQMGMSKFFTLSHIVSKDVTICVRSIETITYLKLFKYE